MSIVYVGDSDVGLTSQNLILHNFVFTRYSIFVYVTWTSSLSLSLALIFVRFFVEKTRDCPEN